MKQQEPQQRRDYTMLDYQYMKEHYHTDSLASCAAALGRTVGSLKSFLQDHPELKKRPRA
ncbi:hypothetical protein [Hymenobacter sp. YC55]|uniref:hypothetical protein n=1 Tax=Hymenobacter sp. YC55 TaxID=3034019 RepID=UPI0023F797AE|nr:hypothetical protein [Hymenobacter sp. YC55]MDF7809938.1 hypothetical protein [Hymenobacter sp. YC55]